MTFCSTVTFFVSPMSNGSDFSAYHVPSEVFLNPSQRNVLGGSSGWSTWAMAGDKEHAMEIRAIAAGLVRHVLKIEDLIQGWFWRLVICPIWPRPAPIASSRRPSAALFGKPRGRSPEGQRVGRTRRFFSRGGINPPSMASTYRAIWLFEVSVGWPFCAGGSIWQVCAGRATDVCIRLTITKTYDAVMRGPRGSRCGAKAGRCLRPPWGCPTMPLRALPANSKLPWHLSKRMSFRSGQFYTDARRLMGAHCSPLRSQRAAGRFSPIAWTSALPVGNNHFGRQGVEPNGEGAIS